MTVNTLKLLIPCSLAMALTVGCQTSYKAAIAARQDLLHGPGEVANRYAQDLSNDSSDRVLGTVEQAHFNFLRGNFAGYSSVMAPELERMFEDSATGPVLKKSEIAGQLLAATVTDDTSIPYALPSYELLFALQYQAFSSICTGNRDNARVYLKRATAAQEQLREENASSDSSEDEKNKVAVDKAVNTVTTQISPIADTVRASYENALCWYLMGLVLESENDQSNADIAYKQAATIAPSVATLPKKAGADDIIVVYEEGIVNPREPIKIPLPIGGTLVSVDFPIYRGEQYIPATMTATIGNTRVPLAKVVDTQALAYRDLKDRIPGMVTRNVTRTAVKIAAQQVANNINTGTSYGNLALKLGVLAANAMHTVVSEADTRSWWSLPMCVQLTRVQADPNVRTLTLANDVTHTTLEVPLGQRDPTAGPIVVWVTDLGSRSRVTVVPLLKGEARSMDAPPLTQQPRYM